MHGPTPERHCFRPAPHRDPATKHLVAFSRSAVSKKDRRERLWTSRVCKTARASRSASENRVLSSFWREFTTDSLKLPLQAKADLDERRLIGGMTLPRNAGNRERKRHSQTNTVNDRSPARMQFSKVLSTDRPGPRFRPMASMRRSDSLR